MQHIDSHAGIANTQCMLFDDMATDQTHKLWGHCFTSSTNLLQHTGAHLTDRAPKNAKTDGNNLTVRQQG